MPTQRFVNNFRTSITATFGVADTFLNLTSVAGLPTLTGGDFFTLTLFRLTGVQESGWEVVKVTSITGNQCTVERSYEGAAASQFLVAGTVVEARWTAKAGLDKADKAALGTAANLNAPATGDASSSELVKGSDTRLTNSRAPTAHQHSVSDLITNPALGGALLINNGGSGVFEVFARDIFGAVMDKTSIAPNTSVPVLRIVAYGGESHLDAALVPKGQGATLNCVPDSTPTGGNKRGQYVTDFQRARSNANQIALGNYSAILGGKDNRAEGLYSAILGGLNNRVYSNYGTVVAGTNNQVSINATYSGILAGQNNSITSAHAVIGGGSSNAITGAGAAVLGGTLNGANGENSAILGGSTNGLDGALSSCLGGQGAYDRSVIGAQVWGGAVSGGGGALQRANYLLAALTSTNTPTLLTTDNGTYGGSLTPNTLVMQDNSVYFLNVRILARNLSTGLVLSWMGDLVFKRGTGVAAVTRMGATSLTQIAGDTSMTVPTVTADTTLGGIKVTVTGANSVNIQWLCHIETLEIVSS